VTLGDRFVNVGVAEQNMLGIAAGLAEAGYIPYAYSIATFATLRGYEFMRNGAMVHNFPVRLVGGGSGFDYGHNGISHFSLEDVGVMSIQPSMNVIAPADPAQARAALRAVHELQGPAYIRLGKESTLLEPLGGRFRLGRLEMLGSGTDVTILALGSIAREELNI
jgi:transketolase